MITDIFDFFKRCGVSTINSDRHNMKIISYTLKSVCAFLFLMFLGSCSSSLKVSTGATDNKPLLFNDEYETKSLNEVTIEGSSFWGIPSFSKNNKNKRDRGFIYTFNGVQLGRTPRIFPIITLVGYTFATGTVISKIGGKKLKNSNSGGFYQGYNNFIERNRIPLALSMALGLPIAGAINNLSWQGTASSGTSQMLYNRLLVENPDVDVFFYPKYDIKSKVGFSSQKATIKARVSGATLKRTIK